MNVMIVNNFSHKRNSQHVHTPTDGYEMKSMTRFFFSLLIFSYSFTPAYDWLKVRKGEREKERERERESEKKYIPKLN